MAKNLIPNLKIKSKKMSLMELMAFLIILMMNILQMILKIIVSS